MSLLDQLLGLKGVQDAGSDKPARGKLNLLGAVTIVDDPDNGRTNVTVGGVAGVTVVDLFTRQGSNEDEPIVAEGYDAGKPRGGGLFVWKSAPGLAHNGATVVGTIGTGRWLRVDSGALDVTWFGAVGDDSTDDTAALQSAIDLAASLYIREVFLPAGVYRITRTLHLGVSSGFTSLALVGQGPCFGNRTTFPGTVIRAMMSDAPAVNVCNGRSTSIRDLTVAGLAEARISEVSPGLALGTVACAVSDTAATDWDDSALDANADARYTPYAGIAIDGWAGTAPSPAYPTTHHAYGDVGSSNVTISRVHIRGFMVGLAIQPSNYDGNGDFVSISDSQITYCKWGVSIGNSQARNTSLVESQFAALFCVVTTNTHGKQTGKLGSTVKDVSVGNTINLLQLGSSSQYGPLKLQNVYSETLWRIGDLAHNTSAEIGLEFDHCSFTFGLQTNARGIPATILSAPSSAARVKFNGGLLYNFPSFASFNVHSLQMDGVAVVSSLSTTTPIKSYLAAAHNATAGGVVMRFGRTDFAHSFRFKTFNIDTGAESISILAADGQRAQTSRPYCVPAWIAGACSSSGLGNDRQPRPRYSTPLAKTSFSGGSVTLTQDGSKPGELTATFAAGPTDNAAMINGYSVGDLVWDDQTGMVFVIRDLTGSVVTAEAQNNYKLSGGVYTTVTPFSGAVGNLYFVPARFYRPTYPVLADATSGNAVLASVQRDDGFSTFLDTDVIDDGSAGDYVYADPQSDNWAANGKMVTAQDTGAKTMTLNANASRTVTRKLIPWFLRRVAASATR